MIGTLLNTIAVVIGSALGLLIGNRLPGGILLIGLALVLLDLKKPRIANFLPALVIAPLMVALATALNITVYPHIP